MQTLRVTLIGLITGVVALGLAGALLGYAAGSVMGNPNSADAFKVGVPAVALGMVAGVVCGLVTGLLKPTMRGWIAGLIIGLVLGVLVGAFGAPVVNPSKGNLISRERVFLSLSFAVVLGFGSSIIGCITGAIIDVILANFSSEK